MELSWISRLRLTLAVAVGIVLMVIVARPYAPAHDPLSPITFFQQRITGEVALALAGFAFAAGLVAYFIAWPYGREMGVVAAPAGLAAFAIQSGNVASLIQMNPDVADRAAMYGTFRYEGLVWLGVVIAGIAGVMVASLLATPRKRPTTAVDPGDAPISRDPKYVGNAFLALCTATVVACIGMLMFVKGVSTPAGTGHVTSQPLTAQIAFGVMMGFGLAAFVVKLAFRLNWLISVAALAVVNFGIATFAASPKLLAQMAQDWPASTFALAPFGILPIQLVSFGALGAMLGYWLAVRYNIWRKEVVVV
jgi:hypothetical protein